jgi:hypothetical protein
MRSEERVRGEGRVKVKVKVREGRKEGEQHHQCTTP